MGTYRIDAISYSGSSLVTAYSIDLVCVKFDLDVNDVQLRTLGVLPPFPKTGLLRVYQRI